MVTALLVVAAVMLGYAALAWALTRDPRCWHCRARVPEKNWTAHRARCGKPRYVIVPIGKPCTVIVSDEPVAETPRHQHRATDAAQALMDPRARNL